MSALQGSEAWQHMCHASAILDLWRAYGLSICDFMSPHPHRSFCNSCSQQKLRGWRFLIARCSGYFKSYTKPVCWVHMKLHLLLLSYRNMQEYAPMGTLHPQAQPSPLWNKAVDQINISIWILTCGSQAWLGIGLIQGVIKNIDSSLLCHSRPGLRPGHLCFWSFLDAPVRATQRLRSKKLRWTTFPVEACFEQPQLPLLSESDWSLRQGLRTNTRHIQLIVSIERLSTHLPTRDLHEERPSTFSGLTLPGSLSWQHTCSSNSFLLVWKPARPGCACCFCWYPLRPGGTWAAFRPDMIAFPHMGKAHTHTSGHPFPEDSSRGGIRPAFPHQLGASSSLIPRPQALTLWGLMSVEEGDGKCIGKVKAVMTASFRGFLTKCFPWKYRKSHHPPNMEFDFSNSFHEGIYFSGKETGAASTASSAPGNWALFHHWGEKTHSGSSKKAKSSTNKQCI